MTQAEFAPIFAFLRGAFPAQVVTADTATAYYAGLRNFAACALKDAVIRACRTSRFWPSIAEIAQTATESAMGLPDPEVILDEIRAAIRDTGWCGKPRLSALAQATVDTIGWQVLCDSDNPEAMRAHVLRVAATYRKRAIEAGNLASVGLAPTVPCPPLLNARGPQLLGTGIEEMLATLRDAAHA